MRADGVIAVCIPKSGTHMLAGLLSSIGYKIRGQGGEPWSGLERAQGGYYARKLGLLPEVCNSESYAWQRSADLVEGEPPLRAPWTNDQALVLHELHLDRIDGQFYRDWTTTGNPRILFLYRDPRACLTSYVHFLRDSKAIAPTPIQLHYQGVLLRFKEFSHALLYAIRDPVFPIQRRFIESRWLLESQRVCGVRYEDLVGPLGHGCRDMQTRALNHIALHLGLKKLPADPYNHESPTFRTGKTQDWMNEWDSIHHAEFKRRYGEILEIYGF